MPRKYLRKILPSHETIANHPHLSRLGHRVRHPSLWHLNRRSVAGAVAAGMITGLIPGSNPVQFLAAAIVAMFARVNLPIAVLTTLYSNPFTIVPLYWLAYKIGSVFTEVDTQAMPHTELSLLDKPVGEWWAAIVHWLLGIGKTLGIGLPILGVILAFVSYYVVFYGWRAVVIWEWRRRARRRAAKGAERPE
ncbi:MAG TPA: DUF2062 domain-containing protein [Burkholderiales bacterium]|nr:DUF2062 domain-containing protein [Burkholderiales bacterium]